MAWDRYLRLRILAIDQLISPWSAVQICPPPRLFGSGRRLLPGCCPSHPGPPTSAPARDAGGSPDDAHQLVEELDQPFGQPAVNAVRSASRSCAWRRGRAAAECPATRAQRVGRRPSLTLGYCPIVTRRGTGSGSLAVPVAHVLYCHALGAELPFVVLAAPRREHARGCRWPVRSSNGYVVGDLDPRCGSLGDRAVRIRHITARRLPLAAERFRRKTKLTSELP